MPTTKKTVLMAMGRLAKTLKLNTQFSGIPGNEYWRGLQKRCPATRMRMMNKAVVDGGAPDSGQARTNLEY